MGKNVPYSFNVDQLEKSFLQPTLMLMGRQDSAVGYRDMWQIIENYPRASFGILDRAGHDLHIDQEILFNEMVKEWLNRLTQAAETSKKLSMPLPADSGSADRPTVLD